MRSFDQLDHLAFRSFYLAAETLNFTEAARRGAMTQSGVSQHIAKLEEQLGVQLFLRSGRTLVLTESGKLLKEYVEKYLDEQDTLREKIANEQRALAGEVRYAMPESCLLSPHFGMLLEKRMQSYPEITLKVEISPSPTVVEKILGGQVDFGFVTKSISHPLLKFTPFCFEEYTLISGKPIKESIESVEMLQKLPFINYPGFDVIFEAWFETHFPKKKNFTWEHLNISGEINSLKGALDMIMGKLGVSVVPRHCAEDTFQKKKIFEIPRTKVVKNQISIVTLANRTLTRRTQAILDIFMAMKS